MTTQDVAAGSRRRRGEPAPATSAPDRRRIREGILYCLKVFLCVRIGLLVLALVAVALLPDATRIANARELAIPAPVGVPGWPAHAIAAGWQNLFTSWERFDALWFLRIADGGYRTSDGSAAFFPLYPLAIRAVSFVLGGRPFAAAMLVSGLSLPAGLCVLYLLTASELSERAARDTVLYLTLFPTSLFLFAPYSEALFLLLSVIAFWAARRRWWWLAALGGALAALTRNVGVLLAPALAVEALHQWREERAASTSGATARLGGRLACALGPVAGTLAYLGFWAARTGDWLAPIHVQQGWQRSPTDPLVTLWRGSREALRWLGTFPGGYHLLDWLIVGPVVVLAAYGLVRLRPAYSIYVWLSLIAPLSYVFEPRPLMSVPRFVVVAFPLFWVLADLTERGRIPRTAVVAVSAAGLGVLTLLFANWYYIF